MIGFTGREILLSVLYALIYGLGFSFVYQLTLIFFRALKSLPLIAKEIFNADKLLPPPTVKVHIKTEREGSAFAFLSVVSFFVGFLLLSYFALDGQLRVYMLFLSSAAFYFANSVFLVVLRGLSALLLDSLLFVISIVVKLFVWPTKLLIKIRKANKFAEK